MSRKQKADISLHKAIVKKCEKNGVVVGKWWKKNAFTEKMGVGGPTVLEKICIYWKNGGGWSDGVGKNMH